MKNTTLVKLSQAMGLPYDEVACCVYGAQDGYPFYIEPTTQNGVFHIAFSVSRPDGALSIEEIKEFTSVNPSVKAVLQNGPSLLFRAKGGMTAAARVENIKQALFAAVTMLRMKGYVSVCRSCGATGDIRMSNIGGNNTHLCESCNTLAVHNTLNSEYVEAGTKENVLAGFVGALLGSVIGLAAIFIVARLGYIAVLPGIVMGVCTVLGYEKLGKKLSLKGIIICCVLMLLMVYLANQLDWAYMIATEFEVGFFEAYGSVMEVVNMAEVMGEYVQNLVMMYIFTAVGAVPMMINAFQQKKQRFVAYRLGERVNSTIPSNHL